MGAAPGLDGVQTLLLCKKIAEAEHNRIFDGLSDSYNLPRLRNEVEIHASGTVSEIFQNLISSQTFR